MQIVTLGHPLRSYQTPAAEDVLSHKDIQSPNQKKKKIQRHLPRDCKTHAK